jgi:hypothetical protein
MKKNPVNLGVHFFLRPIRMPAVNGRRLQFADRPIHHLSQLQSPLARHGAQNGELFRTCLLIRKHDKTVLQKTQPGKLFACVVFVAAEVTRL